jgi:hypothetical protein
MDNVIEWDRVVKFRKILDNREKKDDVSQYPG